MKKGKKKKMPTETDLILKAINKTNEDRYLSEVDPIAKIIKTEEKRKKRESKSIKDWIGKDFLLYINKELKPHSLRLDRISVSESDKVLKLYDDFVSYLKTSMSNKVLKDYFEWWISTHARTLSREEPLFINRMMGRFDIEKFIKSYRERPDKMIEEFVEEVPQQPEKLSDEVIYETSGLSALLMSSGIVKAYLILKKKKADNLLMQISTVLQTFSKKVLTDVMKRTIMGKYDPNDVVDFISLARPALAYHNMKEYLKMDYRQYFSY